MRLDRLSDSPSVPFMVKNGSAMNVGWVSRTNIDWLKLVAGILNHIDAKKVAAPPWRNIEMVPNPFYLLLAPLISRRVQIIREIKLSLYLN